MCRPIGPPLHAPRPYAVVILLALAAYLPGFWWGAPHATAPDRVGSWGVDDETPLGPLAQMNDIRRPSPTRNLGYPLGYSFLAAAAYAPYLAWLFANGGLDGVSAVYPFGLADPVAALRTLSWIAHLLTVLLGVASVVAAYDTGAVLWGRTSGLLSALFAMTIYPMFYYARTGNVDVPTLAFTAAAVAAFARIAANGITRRRVVALGVFAGLALGTKEVAVGVLLPIALATIALARRSGERRATLVALVAFAFALAASSGALVDPERYVAHLRFIFGRAQALPDVESFHATFPFTMAGHLVFARSIGRLLVHSLTLPGVLLASAGILWACVRDRRALPIALATAAHLTVMFLTLRSGQLRYLLPAAFVLGLFAGRAVHVAWGSGPWLRGAGVVLGAWALGLQVVHGASLTHEMIRDSRHAAGAWLARNLESGDRVEFFGASQKLPPLDRTIVTERALPYRGMWGHHATDEGTARAVAARWAKSPPAAVLVIPDHTSRPGRPYDASVPPALYERLVAGDAGLELAAFFQTPPLVPGLERPPLDYPSVNPPIRIFAPAPKRPR